MINITNSGNAIIFDMGDGNRHTFPKNTIIATQDNDSETVNIKLDASRKTVLSVNYKEVATPTSSSSSDLINKLNTYLY